MPFLIFVKNSFCFLTVLWDNILLFSPPGNNHLLLWGGGFAPALRDVTLLRSGALAVSERSEVPHPPHPRSLGCLLKGPRVSSPERSHPGLPAAASRHSSETHWVNLMCHETAPARASPLPGNVRFITPRLGCPALLGCSRSTVEPNGIIHSCLLNWLNLIKMWFWPGYSVLTCVYFNLHTHPQC